MPRVVSPAMLAAWYGSTTSQILLTLLRIKHASIPEGGILRFVQDLENVTVTTATGDQDPDRVGEYIACAFEIAFPDDIDDRIPSVVLEIVNADRLIVDTIRTLPPEQAPPVIALELVLRSQPNTLDIAISDVVLRVSEWDAATVRGDLSSDDPLNEGFPGDSHTPITNPGLFRIPVG